MKYLNLHKIVNIDYPGEHFFDFDNETSELLRKNFENEITAMNLIRSGDLKKLDEYLEKNNSAIILGYSNTKLGNERAFAERTLALSSIAAINGGVDCTVVYSLIFNFQSIIESTAEPNGLIALAYDILREFCKTVGFLYYKKCKSPVLLPVLRYIHSNLNSKITVKEVAEKLNMNENYLSQLFKKEMGENFIGYVNNSKIAFAKHLMQTTDKSVAEISEYLAFSSQSHFGNVFRKLTGTTPKQYLFKVKRI